MTGMIVFAVIWGGVVPALAFVLLRWGMGGLAVALLAALVVFWAALGIASYQLGNALNLINAAEAKAATCYGPYQMPAPKPAVEDMGRGE